MAAALALSVYLFRSFTLKSGMPPPYGRGEVTKLDSRRSMRDGVLIVLGGAGSLFAVFATAYLFNPFLVFFPLVLGLMMGLPLSQVLYFLHVGRLEQITRSRIYSVTEESFEDGMPVLLKSIELA